MNCIEITAETAEDLIKLVQALRKENLSESVSEVQKQKGLHESGDVQTEERLEETPPEEKEEPEPVEELVKELRAAANVLCIFYDFPQEAKAIEKAANVLHVFGEHMKILQKENVDAAIEIMRIIKGAQKQ